MIVIVCSMILLLFIMSTCIVNRRSARLLQNFNNTPVWELAQAVNHQSVWKINFLCKKHPEWINYQEPIYGMTLLYWSVGANKYSSAEALLKNGADPDVITSDSKNTALLLACGYLWDDMCFTDTTKYIALLLKYGANPNLGYGEVVLESGLIPTSKKGSTPLMEVVVPGIIRNSSGVKKARVLVEYGANINTKLKSGETAASIALLQADYSLAYYLIVELHANITEVCYDSTQDDHFINPTGVVQQPVKLYPVQYLRNWDWVFPLHDKKYKMKQEIIAEFTRQGIDYYATPIPQDTVDYIKKRFPKNWEEMLEKF